ncbi:MAG: UDP-N-acetylglucosamine 2-epimerase (hydrolyzing) [Bacteroidetes bacterium]|nr:UDP-N-acetylglucosamine 2-epimerase (hydrolyzing) [Bacteroidota bacterium]
MRKPIKIAVFTAARSEYGPLKPLLKDIHDDEAFDLNLLVAGAHFLESQGKTIEEIKNDNFPIAAEFNCMQEDESGALAISKSNGRLQIALADYFSENHLDLLLVLGDRSELIPVVSASLFAGIPIAHLSGGEVTEGATDDQIRHAVTKMSHLHFPATETYRENILRMGEEAWRICVSGEPSLDSILSMSFTSEKELYEKYNLLKGVPFVLATIHSETIGQTIDQTFLDELLTGLLAHTNDQYLFTAANVDVGGQIINETLSKWSASNPRIHFVKSLGKTNYYSALKCAKYVLGNSSSGIIEAQSFGLPVLNIGNRQAGRLRNKNVMDCPVDLKTILASIPKLTSEEFKESYIHASNIYGDGNASSKIIDFIKQIPFENLLYKKSTF